VKKKLFFVAIILFALVLVGCGKSKKSPIIGSWDYSGFVYVFNEDMTGSYTAGGTEMKFTYEDDGEKVTITYEGNTKGSTYEYKVEDDKLIIKDSFDNEVEYYKK
jgi:major membrane immunogen (membrane-anchored lipoprotein)